jgi:hypothetical protein
LKARSAELHHAAANVDREDNHAPGSVVSTSECLTPHVRLDNPDHRRSMASQRSRPPTTDSSVVLQGAGDRVTHRSLAFYDAVGKAMARENRP